MARRFGLERKDIIGKRLPEVIGAGAHESFREYVERALAGERGPVRTEVPYEALGLRRMQARCVPCRAGGREPAGFVAIIADVTERRAPPSG